MTKALIAGLVVALGVGSFVYAFADKASGAAKGDRKAKVLAKWDKDGDGKISDEEKAAAKAARGEKKAAHAEKKAARGK
jgi:hypothetical protein